jgi:hypothetical protein
VTIPVSITNTGIASEQYFADARLATSATVLLPGTGTGQFLPVVQPPQFLVPPEARSLAIAAQSTVGITMDAPFAFGDPDLWAQPDPNAADTVVATLSEPELPYGIWRALPAEIGPYGASGAPTVPVTVTAQAVMQPFDPAVSADSGDPWEDAFQGTQTYHPLVLAPAQAGIITVTITPAAGQVGETITGYLYVDTLNPATDNGDEVVRIPYRYTVAPAS